MFGLQDRVRHNRYRRKLDPKHRAHDTPFPGSQQGFVARRRRPPPGRDRYNPLCRHPAPETVINRPLNRLAQVQPGEWAAVLWSFAYFFCLLCGYYVLRPVRDEMGIQAGVGNLPWLFTATFFAMLAAAPLFGWVSSRFPRRQFLPFVYLFFVANLLLFYVLFREKTALEVTTKAFFVWVSVFNLFVVSVFWSFMADLYDTAQARRLYGFIAAGGSLGAITGPALTTVLAPTLGPVNLLLVSAGFLAGRRLLHPTTGPLGSFARITGSGVTAGHCGRRRRAGWDQASDAVALLAGDLPVRGVLQHAVDLPVFPAAEHRQGDHRLFGAAHGAVRVPGSRCQHRHFGLAATSVQPLPAALRPGCRTGAGAAVFRGGLPRAGFSADPRGADRVRRAAPHR